jgi:chemotaxis signal transduction protein
LAGVGKIDDRLLILLDVDKILSTDEKIQLQSLQEQEAQEAQ